MAFERLAPIAKDWNDDLKSGQGIGRCLLADRTQCAVRATRAEGSRILLAMRPVDFRKGAHSLAALAAEVLGADPFSGVLLVFRSRRADRVKILVWDGSGMILVWKQLEGGAFRWPPVVDGVLRLTPVEFAALFDGIDWRRVQTLREIFKPSVPA